MKVKITDKTVTIEQEGTLSTHNIGSLRYHYTSQKDSITFKEEGFSVTAPVNEITVNDTQMTSDNIEQLLEPIFSLFGADINGILSDMPLLISQSDFDNLSEEEKSKNNYDVYIS